MKRVAIQGYSGCFHEQAARLFWCGDGARTGAVPLEEDIQTVECDTFDGLYAALDTGKADSAVMAIENTVSGGLLPNFELLRKHDVKIKGEVFLRIGQNLMALPGQRIEDIREVRTHYMAINQTRPFFAAYPHIRLVESEDTAKMVCRAECRVFAAPSISGRIMDAIGAEYAADGAGLFLWGRIPESSRILDLSAGAASGFIRFRRRMRLGFSS